MNDPALPVLDTARPLTAARPDYVVAPEGGGLVSGLYIRAGTGPKRYWLSALRRLGIRQRRTHDAPYVRNHVPDVRYEPGIHRRAIPVTPNTPKT